MSIEYMRSKEVPRGRRRMEPRCLAAKRSQRASQRLHSSRRRGQNSHRGKRAKYRCFKGVPEGKEPPSRRKMDREARQLKKRHQQKRMEEGAMMPVVTAATLPIMAGGFKIILKDAKIYAKKVIIRTMKGEKKS